MMAQPRSCWAHLQSDGPPQSHGISQNWLALALLHCNCTVAATPRQAHAITFPRGPARYTAAHAPTLLRTERLYHARAMPGFHTSKTWSSLGHYPSDG